jgi:hypothetical protein
VGFQERDDIANPFVLGEYLRFAQTEEFLNPRQWLVMIPTPFSFPASAGEGEFGDAGFVEVAKSFRNHAVELVLGGFGEWEVEAFFMGEGERDAAVFCSVGAGEEAGVVAVLHVLSIGFENLGVCAGLRKNFAQHGQIKPECGSEP